MESKEVIKVLDALGEKLGVAVDWTSDNVAPYVQELMGKCVSYELWTSVMWITISILGLVLIGIFIKKMSCFIVGRFGKVDGDDILMLFAIGIFPSIILAIVIIYQFSQVIACLTFPEKVIIDMITAMNSK